MNQFNIRDKQQLSIVERETSIVEAAVLIDNITDNFDLDFSVADEGGMLEASIDSFMYDYGK